MFYSEEVSHDGRWMPRTSTNNPVVKSACGVVRTLNGNVRIRAIVKVNDSLQKLTLGQLRECYSPDGKFYRNTKRNENVV